MKALPLIAALPALLLAACEGGGDPVQQALQEEAAANHAEVALAREAAGHGDHAQAGGTVADAAFPEGEARMHQEMGEASGETIDESYIAKMIAHHRGAVAMAEVALARSEDPEIRRMAQVVIDAQVAEIAEMEAWRPAAGAADPHAGH